MTHTPLTVADVCDIGTAIEYLREKRHWSRERLAHDSGSSYFLIARIEQGKNTSVRILLRICATLDVTLADLATLAGV